MSEANKTVDDFLRNKPELTQSLFQHFVNEYVEIGAVTLHAAKTMIGIDNGSRRIAYITQLGKNFIHVVFPFTQPYPDNLCFTKIAQVPGDAHQFNHHFRMYHTDDVNEEVKHFMKVAYHREQSIS